HKSDEAALRSSRLLSRQLPPQFRVWDWKETNSTLFQAVETEKPILFFVIGLMVLAASVNVAASLNIQVASKTPQLSTLRALGLRSSSVLRVFMNQGLILGLLGSLLGLILGLFFCALFSWLEESFGILPGEVYKIDRLQVDLRWMDLAAILSLSIGLSVLAVFRSARRAAFLRPAEGLRYE
ncbi:MAG: FtsX-like permease family protein, partial [Bdellovibrio sp.]